MQESFSQRTPFLPQVPRSPSPLLLAPTHYLPATLSLSIPSFPLSSFMEQAYWKS